MTQEQLKEQWFEYATNNLNNQSILEVMTQLLDNISNELHENGYTHESNRLTTAELIIKEVLASEK